MHILLQANSQDNRDIQTIPFFPQTSDYNLYIQMEELRGMKSVNSNPTIHQLYTSSICFLLFHKHHHKKSLYRFCHSLVSSNLTNLSKQCDNELRFSLKCIIRFLLDWNFHSMNLLLTFTDG